MAQVDITKALAYLKTSASAVGAEGTQTSVFDHLAQVIQKILDEKPANAVDILETSYLVKRTAIDAKESSPLVPVPVVPDATKAVATASLFGKPDLPIDPATGEPVEAEIPNEYECEDIKANAVMFDALGVGLGREEMYGVMLAAKQLGVDPKRGILKVRFFGKFLGLYADYYVFEAKFKNSQEVQPAKEGDVPVESNNGANEHTYFVCNYLGGPLTQLPPTQPGLIKAARTIKKFLTGRLTSHVSSFPVFPGTEADYLRAQIARIAATTMCCPNGSYNPPEDEGLPITPNEDFEAPENPRDYGNIATWVHWYPHLKKQGRCELFKREVPEDVEDEDAFFTEDEKEEGPELLSPLEADAPLNGIPPWTALFSSSSEAVKNQVAGLRSVLWPGAFCAAKGKKFANIYVGWGLKNVPFVPQPPPPVAVEFDPSQVESQELPLKPVPPAEDGDDEEL